MHEHNSDLIVVHCDVSVAVGVDAFRQAHPLRAGPRAAQRGHAGHAARLPEHAAHVPAAPRSGVRGVSVPVFQARLRTIQPGVW